MLFDGGLEDEADERVGGVALVFVAVGGLHGGSLVRGGAVLEDEVHEALDALVVAGGGADHGEGAAVGDTEFETLDHVFLGEGAFFEELVHEGLFVLSGSLDEGVVHLLSLVGEVGGDVFHHHLATVGGELEELHLEQVDDGVEADTGIHRVLQGHHAAAEVLLELMKSLIEVGLLVVELVDDEHHGDVHSLRVTPLDLGTHVHAVLAVDHHQSGVHHAHCTDGLANEIIKTRAIHHIDLASLIFSIHHRALDGLLSFQLDFAIVGNGVLVLYGTSSADDTAVKSHSLGQCRLTYAVTANDGNVSDLFGLIYFHWRF